MASAFALEKGPINQHGSAASVPSTAESVPKVEIQVALLTGGIDRPYAYGLAMALISNGVRLDVIGSYAVDSPEMHSTPRLTFLNLQSGKQDASLARKAWSLLAYYLRLIGYVSSCRPTILHILWNNKFQYFDRICLMMYYRLRGKKLVFTAHNVNAGKRDGNDSVMNRLTLRIQYRLLHHIFVHTEKMKAELLEDFGVRAERVTVIRFPVNDAFPDTALTPAQARKKLGLGESDKAILFYGAIRPYKGLEYLVDAFHRLVAKHPEYRLIIAAEPKKGSEQYLEDILRKIDRGGHRQRIIERLEFIPDQDTELYYKAADVLALPYKEIFQSGVLFVGYTFGLPVVAADVGSFRVDIREGKTGFLCKPLDVADLARAIENYFESDLFKNLDRTREDIREFARVEYSWHTAAEKTCTVYGSLLNPQNAKERSGGVPHHSNEF
jgi:D-inositol-3-phosphate glycosyltransferase